MKSINDSILFLFDDSQNGNQIVKQNYIVRLNLQLSISQMMYRRDHARQGSFIQKKKIKHFSYSESDRIGKGYSSIVYKGLNELTNETIAVKAIDMKGVKDDVSRQMLDCQIQALTKLKHQNILKCFDVVRETSHCFIITQYCNEGDLSGLLKKKRRLPQKEVLKLMKDIVSGFIQMAENNFLHRDLKLANIFISDGRAVIADFGFAKKNSNRVEKEKYNVGSPLYMSPEALKKNIYSIKNDIWSIGVMIYELLHGQTPWECQTQKQLMDKMVRIPVKFRDSLGISEDIKTFIRKCLEVDEEKRMSLTQMKNWNSSNSIGNEVPIKKNMEFMQEPQLSRKPFSSKQNYNALSEVTNKLGSRSQSNLPFNSLVSKQSAHQNLNRSDKQSKLSTNKNYIEGNNNILVTEINTFRLLFKIHEKLKQIHTGERELINTIGNEVVKRVNNVLNTICPDKQNSNMNRSQTLGLQDLQKYLNEQINPSVKKYKSVVKQYHKKYTQQISLHALGRQISLKSIMKETLKKGEIMKDMGNSEEIKMVFWMLEFVNLTENPKKEYLDQVIECKTESFAKPQILAKIKSL